MKKNDKIISINTRNTSHLTNKYVMLAYACSSIYLPIPYAELYMGTYLRHEYTQTKFHGIIGHPTFCPN